MASIEFIMDAADLAKSIGSAATAAQVAAPSSAGSTGPSMTVTVLNHTQFFLTPVGSYFDSGRFNVAPGGVSPFKGVSFTACAKDNSVLTGVTGAASYSMTLTNGTCNVGVGFCNPEIGSYKSNIAFDPDQNQTTTTPVLSVADFTEGTYNCSTDTTVNATSAVFSGSDRNGNPVNIQFTGSAVPGQNAVITVVQNVVPTSS